MKGVIFGFCWVVVSACCGAGEVKVVSLHPLVSDLLRKVGGGRVEVVDLLGEKGDPHKFKPSAEELGQVRGASLYFVSGMGLEEYLPELAGILGDRGRIVEVGKTLPGLEGGCDHEGHEGDHGHGLDPHWWHSVELFSRAVGVVEDELKKVSPEDAEFFRVNAEGYRGELERLERWVRWEVKVIPKERRVLVTAHDAFGYFAEAYGFESRSVQGLNREQMPDAGELAELVAELRKDKVAAIFPERESNPKMLESLTRDAGVVLGGELIADGMGVKSYVEMVKKNVGAMVAGLR